MKHDYYNAAIEIAKEAGDILKKMSLENIVVTEKGSAFDFVTNADNASQSYIKERLQHYFPTHYFVGEEDGKTDKDVAAFLKNISKDEYCWICDPLDGTMNYIRHYLGYAVSLACYHAGEIIVGVTYTPVENELFAAELGNGATCNGFPIHVSEVDKLTHAITTTGIPPTNMDWRNTCFPSLNRVAFNTLNLRIIGCATRCIAYVAAGRFESYWEVGPHPWDVAAGSLLVREAGGNICTLTGEAYSFGEPRFMATNGKIDQSLIKAINWPD